MNRLEDLTDAEWLELLVSGKDVAGFIPPPIPALSFQRGFNGGVDSQANLDEALAFYRVIKGQLTESGPPLIRSRSKILDFGSGWGRIARFFLKDVDAPGIFGVDVNPVGIEECQRSMTDSTWLVNEIHPPLPFGENEFDLVYAYSVFSHLPEALHLAWLYELTRLLRPGGLLVVTTLRRSFIESAARFRDTGDTNQRWQQLAAESFEDTVSAISNYDNGQYMYSPKPRAEYGMALIPERYVRRRWTKLLKFIDYDERAPGLAQNVIVMMK